VWQATVLWLAAIFSAPSKPSEPSQFAKAGWLTCWQSGKQRAQQAHHLAI